MQTQSYHQCWRRILRGRACPTRIKRTINWEAVGQLLSNPSILVIIQQATRATNIVVNKTHQIDRWTHCLYQVCMSDAYFTVREYSAVGDLVYVVWEASNCGVRVVNVGGSIAPPASATSALHTAIQALKLGFMRICGVLVHVHVCLLTVSIWVDLTILPFANAVLADRLVTLKRWQLRLTSGAKPMDRCVSSKTYCGDDDPNIIYNSWPILCKLVWWAAYACKVMLA